jgi:dihydroneopterin aldolase
MESYILLNNLRIYAYHGVYDEERVQGNTFVVSLRLECDVARAAQTDEVGDTVSYADVCEAVKAEMAIPSRLLEHVCGRIVRRIFADFPAVRSVCVSVSKCRPPMDADVESAGVEMHVRNPAFF